MRKGGNDLLECPEGWISDLLPVLRMANDALQYVLGRRRLVQLGRADGNLLPDGRKTLERFDRCSVSGR